MSRMWMSHVTHISSKTVVLSKSRHRNVFCGCRPIFCTYGWAMSQMWLRHVMHATSRTVVLFESWQNAFCRCVTQCIVLQCVAACCFVLQNVAECCSVLQCSWAASQNYFARMNESCHTCEWVMSHMWMIHVTQMNESCHTHEWSSDIWMSHVTRMTESRHTYEPVMSHMWVRHVTLANESSHTCKSSKIPASHLTRLLLRIVNESYHTYERVVSQMWVRHVTLVNEACHIFKKNIKNTSEPLDKIICALCE